MYSRNYIPTTYAGLLSWLRNFLDQLVPKLERLGIPTTEFESLRLLISNYNLACEKANSTAATKTDRVRRAELAELVTKAARNFVNVFLRYNKELTNDDRTDLGLPIPSTKPTPIPPPANSPSITSFDKSENMRIRGHYKDSKSQKSRAKPYGVHGLSIRWVIQQEPPVDISQFTNVSFSTKTPFTLRFAVHERGKTLWLRICWENTKGEGGPWSDLYSVVIP
ncbi:MAG: hypothetical protein LBG28_16095 [Tannerella sp.]|jgi:hypothetical protein|nr:hypothetical protein [Tannerella sp.]